AAEREGLPGLEGRHTSLRQDLEARDTEVRNGKAELAQLDEVTLTAEHEQAAIDAGIAQRELRDVQEFRLPPDARIAMERRIQELEASVASLLTERGAAGVQAEEQSGLQDRLAECGERIEALAAQERFWGARAKVDEAIAGLLAEARGRALADIAEELPRRAGAILGTITGGRHREVRARDLSFELWSPEKQGALVEDEFSGGTLDQFYLALRLAVVQTLFAVERPPLLLDEPLAHCDPTRRCAILELLRQYAEGGQVLVFTCHDFREYVGHPMVPI
ncbi:MAG: hypothetical protein L0191_20775, partial [Acidobacteria bacterium]|nr:hypothetical protein [Acidobacteriota bacterium]